MQPNPLVLNVTQSVQLAALGPCVFLVLYLLLSIRNIEFKYIFIPFLYFISLTAIFLLPIMIFFPSMDNKMMYLITTTNQYLIPELSYLLIAQLILRKPPPLIYWSVLLLPIFGYGPFIYLSAFNEELCIQDVCAKSSDILDLYSIFIGGLIFMLITIILARHSKKHREEENKLQKYWLIIMLILYNLFIPIVDLLHLNNNLSDDKTIFIKTMIGVSFVYLVLSSIFRVFHKNFHIKPLSNLLTDRDKILAKRINVILEQEKLYLVSGFNRSHMADQLAVTEQHLSRIVNNIFQQSFTELINDYRIEYAKKLLQENKQSVTDIIYESGFNSIATFNRVFKQKTDLTPSAYRKQQLS